MSVYDKEFGLEQVAEIDYSDGCYQFDYRIVWWHPETRKLYTGRDSGCSCPSPFEDYFKLEDLDELTDMLALREEARSEGPKYNTPEVVQTFLHKVETVFKEDKTMTDYTLKCVDCGVPVGTMKQRMVPARCVSCKSKQAAR